MYDIVAIYAPDGDNHNYFTTTHGDITNNQSDYQILIGDFAITPDPLIDRIGYLTVKHPKGINVINS